MGTWIEIIRIDGRLRPEDVVPYVGTWIEILGFACGVLVINGRSLRGNVDRNEKFEKILTDNGRRSLRGNVDRNLM